jgi:small subunit ribosomal protein S21
MGNFRKPAWKRDSKPRIEGGRVGPLEVAVIDNNIERAMKELKNKMSREGVLTELKKRRFAEKPSEKKRRKHREALKKMRKSRGRKARQRAQAVARKRR